ncbi:hypothetical protein [Mesorhizobium sp. M0816]|uniref:hypothetical protein n=1 Tax=Mesorhizobium sp. M0816 TaxID=2957006 RepID=UPI00333AB903
MYVVTGRLAALEGVYVIDGGKCCVAGQRSPSASPGRSDGSFEVRSMGKTNTVKSFQRQIDIIGTHQRRSQAYSSERRDKEWLRYQHTAGSKNGPSGTLVKSAI